MQTWKCNTQKKWEDSRVSYLYLENKLVYQMAATNEFQKQLLTKIRLVTPQDNSMKRSQVSFGAVSH